ncbi:S8 family peptidase [Abyssalbus ytuae]|uniref:S8 family peptidase n=1 Tax=Abyssalbus ytuae TaxID=2926907 RepID=A0A9E7D3J7_9FLAO|nr:S8 family peptidase [Abyssalbus ytuae]UOB19388.1 S8 family peptidase [Abyssalbus ytuae]
MKIIKPLLSTALSSVFLVGCGSTVILPTPVENIDSVPIKSSDLTDNQLKQWGHMDLVKDTVPGMSVTRAYQEVLGNKKGQTVIVGVIDSGVDISHEDLDGVIWTNPKEKPNNGIDDDKNGYVDDIHGWNFLGNAVDENLEFTRILKKKDDGSEVYKAAKEEFNKEYADANEGKTRYEQILQAVNNADEVLKNHFGKEVYTKEEVAKISTEDEELQQAAAIISQMFTIKDSIAEVKEELKNGIEYFTDKLNYHLNLEFDGRAVVGDNPDDITDTNYGNNNVVGPDKEEAKHGTHVAGIIAAERNNGIGMDGVANNVKIMVVRAVPNGDEYDKDVALAIRYAADNGAKVINTSFGKYFSPHSEWVRDAIKYAASKDVLIVNAAGNEAFDLDSKNVYPNDAIDNSAEVADNFLTVGALNYKYGSDLIATFSNYGKRNVDVFAPGTKIWSTVPNSKYEFLQGTSMASPAVAGVAALIRSQYPKLTASQVKKIIMASGLNSKSNVILGGNTSEKRAFTDISTSGRMVNAYNALILADKVSRGVSNL